MPTMEAVTPERVAKPPAPTLDRNKQPVRRRRRRRVQLDLLPDIFDRVTAVQERNGLDSARAVFRHAFRFYEWYTARRHEGWKIQLVKDGTVVFVDLGLDGERQPRYLDYAEHDPQVKEAAPAETTR